MMKKIISIIAGAALTAALPLNCAAYDDLPAHAGTELNRASARSDSMNVWIMPETAYVKASDLKNGDVTVHVRAYPEFNSADYKFLSATMNFDFDKNAMYLANMTDPSDSKASEELVYTYSGGSFKTTFVPFCFGRASKLSSSSYLRYSSGNAMSYVSNYATDGWCGEYLHSDGKGGFYFIVKNYTTDGITKYDKTYATDPAALGLDENAKETGRITYTENAYGGIDFSYGFRDYVTVNGVQIYNDEDTVRSYSLYHYDGKGAKGDFVPGNNDAATWTSTNVASTSPGSFILGEKDEFPFVEFDCVLKKGTGEGEYKISLDSSKTNEFLLSDKTYYSVKSGNMTVTGGVINVVSDSYKIPEPIQPKVVGEKQTYNLGDTNEDGFVDSLDATDILIRYAAAMLDDKIIKAESLPAGDANKDGEVDSRDATVILIAYAGALVDDKTLTSL